MRAVLKSPKRYSGIVGTVSELFQMEEKYNIAFQAALGHWSQCLVSKDRATAKHILSVANKQEIGSLSILPIKELNA